MTRKRTSHFLQGPLQLLQQNFHFRSFLSGAALPWNDAHYGPFKAKSQAKKYTKTEKIEGYPLYPPFDRPFDPGKPPPPTVKF